IGVNAFYNGEIIGEVIRPETFFKIMDYILLGYYVLCHLCNFLSRSGVVYKGSGKILKFYFNRGSVGRRGGLGDLPYSSVRVRSCLRREASCRSLDNRVLGYYVICRSGLASSNANNNRIYGVGVSGYDSLLCNDYLSGRIKSVNGKMRL